MSDIYLSITETPSVVTLSAPVVSGVLASTVTVANTVTVALDANSLSALENVTVTVGAAVSVSNFPATQQVAGTVTIGNSVTIGSCVTHGVNVANSVTISSLPAIYGTVTATAIPEQLNWYTLKITGPDSKYAGYYTFVVGSSINGQWWSPVSGATYGHVGDTFNPLVIRYGLDITGGGRWSGNRWALWDDDLPIFWDDEGQADIRNCDFNEQDTWVVEPCSAIPTSVIYSSPIQISNLPSVQTISGTVTVSSLPVQLSTTTIGGTARLNVTLSSATTVGATAPSYANLYGGSDGTNLRAISVDTSGRTVVTGSTSILGTPTVTFGAVTGSVSILGTPSVTMGAISGTVTANNPNGTLTTRFGSVTTANTAQITTAVTNANRRYLLCQNLDPSVTVTIGIGFTPTTTQGIQLAAGGGIIMDSFVSTGAVWWLSSSAGSNFSILEG